MNRDGLAQAEERLRRLRTLAATVSSAVSLQERETAWLDFVYCHGTFYSKLEQASKSATASKKWFDGKKAERKSDELLSYMLHARNAGEHTIERTAGKAVISVTGRPGLHGGKLGISIDKSGKFHPFSEGFKDVKVHSDEIMLQAAKSRGIAYKPPREHLGLQIEGHTAREVADLALRYAEKTLAEASALAS